MWTMHQGILLTQQPRMTVMTSETKHDVSSIACNAVQKAMNEVEIATAIDRVLQAVVLCLVTNIWHQPPSAVSLAEQSRYENVKNELTCTTMRRDECGLYP